jgi:hypothetical protein
VIVDFLCVGSVQEAKIARFGVGNVGIECEGLPDHPVISNPSTFDHPTLIAYSIAPSIEAIFIGTT